MPTKNINDLDKKEQKELNNITKLYDKCLKTKTIDEAFEIIKKEHGVTLLEKYQVVFLLGRLYEKQINQSRIDKFEEMNAEMVKQSPKKAK